MIPTPVPSPPTPEVPTCPVLVCHVSQRFALLLSRLVLTSLYQEIGHIPHQNPLPPMGNRSYQCDWLVGGAPCARGFDTLNGLTTHLGDDHGARGHSDRELVCRWSTRMGPCNKVCRRRGFRRHISTHLKLSVNCDYCDKSFSRVDTLRAHIKTKHA